MKLLSVALGILLISNQSHGAGAIPHDVFDALMAAQTDASATLAKNDDSALVASSFLQGHWMFVKRMCVTGLSPSEIMNPTSIEANTNHRVIVSIFNKTSQNSVVTQDAKSIYSGLGDVCTYSATSKYTSSRINKPISGTNLTLLEVFTQNQLNSLGTAGCGPSTDPHTRWKFANVVSVLKIDDNHAYFFLAPGQLAGSTSDCPNNGFKLDLLERLVP